MKFLNYFNKNKSHNHLNNKIILEQTINFLFNEKLNNFYTDYEFIKNIRKKRKILNKIKLGITNNIKKNSLKRDENFTILQQYINLNQKKGIKFNLNKNINIFLENFFNLLKDSSNNLSNYENYNEHIYLYNNNPNYSDINFIIKNSFKDLESIFEIKSIKNSKKKDNNSKYSYSIVYIPKQKRFKYVLRNLSLLKNSYKNYNFWERIFWSFFTSITQKKNSFLIKRKNYIYLKSINFFKKTKK